MLQHQDLMPVIVGMETIPELGKTYFINEMLSCQGKRNKKENERLKINMETHNN